VTSKELTFSPGYCPTISQRITSVLQSICGKLLPSKQVNSTPTFQASAGSARNYSQVTRQLSPGAFIVTSSGYNSGGETLSPMIISRSSHG
jgi:hypothetical protein